MRWHSALALLAGAIAGFLTAEGIHSATKAGEASKIKHSMGSAVNLLDAVEKFRSEKGGYPTLPIDGAQLSELLVPAYLPEIPTDAFGLPFVVVSYGSTPAVVSLGRGGFVVTKGGVVAGTEHLPEALRRP